MKEQESGLGAAEVCRRHGISPATFYKWKARFGCLEVSEARRLKTLLAEAMLDNAVLKDVAEKMVTPAARRAVVAQAR